MRLKVRAFNRPGGRAMTARNDELDVQRLVIGRLLERTEG